MHEVHCRRNIVLCEQCEDPVPRSELEAHFDEYHAKAPCPVCQDDVEKCKLDAHQVSMWTVTSACKNVILPFLCPNGVKLNSKIISLIVFLLGTDQFTWLRPIPADLFIL